jgi:hypothetical protein
MTSLDVKIYNSNFASIKDLSKDINIGDVQWNSLFEILTKLFDNIYFEGARIWSKVEEFDQTLNYLSEQVLIDTRKNHSKILFRLKNSSILYNRKLASQIWDYYEYPCFIFLGDVNNEQKLIQACEVKPLNDDIIESVEDIVIMYRSFEQNVLWIKSNLDIKEILKSVGH